MDRYSDQFDGDSTIATQGDAQIVGMDRRSSPEQVRPGYAQYLQNQRLENLQVTTRKGLSKITDEITPSSVPLIIPFIVGSSATITDTVTDGIFASWVYSDPLNDNQLYIFAATASKVYTVKSSDYSVGTINFPAGELIEPGDSVDMKQAGGQVYILRGRIGTSFTATSIASSAASTATVTLSASSTLATGNYVRIQGATPTGYNGDYQITINSPTAFHYTMVSAQATNASGTFQVNQLKIPLVWNGDFSSSFTRNTYGVIDENFIYMPTADWMLLQQNRAILGYQRNQVIVSQIENVNSCDDIDGVFTFAAGTNDYLIGGAPYQDTGTIIFNRNSVWLINGMNGDVSSMTTQLITDQIGCCSRNSIATCGPNVLFLSELGVFQLQPGFELTLRGNSLPLSAAVNPIIQTINFGVVDAPFAAYWSNRYYLAIPVKGSTRNNAMLVYNFINNAWESYDTFPMGFYCDELRVMLNGSGIPTLYAISYEGGIYATEQNEQDDFAAAGSPPTQYLIDGQFLTRRYTFDSPGIKKFNRVTYVTQLNAASGLSGVAYLINPEDTRDLPPLTNAGSSAMQVTRPAFVNRRGYAIEINFENTAGRVAITNYTVGAYLTDQKTVKIT